MYKVYWRQYINYIGDGSRIFLRRTLRHKKKIKEPNLILSNLTETNIFSYGELSHGELSKKYLYTGKESGSSGSKRLQHEFSLLGQCFSLFGQCLKQRQGLQKSTRFTDLQVSVFRKLLLTCGYGKLSRMKFIFS